MVRPLGTFSVSPSLPPELTAVKELAENLRWTWDHDSIELFRRLDQDLWEETGHNPIEMLSRIPQRRLEELSRDPAFRAHLEEVHSDFRRYMARPTNHHIQTAAGGLPPRIAYFSMEFGLTESLPTYSGGLGVLAGDALKSASDLGLDLVGVGLLFRQGYFKQRLTIEGWQQEEYPTMDYSILPVRPVLDGQGSHLTLELALPDRPLAFRVWRVQVGRVPLFFLDANIMANSPADRDVTDRLYGGDADMRLRQEMLLGMGGLRALAAYDLWPDVIQMNEGHAAFAGLERIRVLMEDKGLTFSVAREIASSGQLFTTHTPVAAGFDLFGPELIGRYLSGTRKSLGLSHEEFMALGRMRPADAQEPFNMAVLALKLSHWANGVSDLHAEVARRMWSTLWPEVPGDETPIGHVTNGVHHLSWISREMAELYDRYLGPAWREEPGDQSVWERVRELPEEELWRTHERRRERLVVFARRELRRQLESKGARRAEVVTVEEVLDPRALTIGFARRFALYKRGTLLFRDPERLARLLTHPERPVQILFAGKAHPQDEAGKQLIQEIYHQAQEEPLRRRIVFLEDYSMIAARYLVQGCDLWLNTPRRPREASGTSGMKAAANGGLNLSVLDGWWAEAYRPDVGWAIGAGEEYEDPAYQDELEAAALYNLLEEEIVPMFYDRSRDGLPRAWVETMKASMRLLCPVFNTNRMLSEYAEKYYFPAARRRTGLLQDGLKPARALAEWKERVRWAWPQLEIRRLDRESSGHAVSGDTLHFHASVRLGALSPQDVAVQLYVGRLDSREEILPGRVVEMTPAGQEEDGVVEYTAALAEQDSGRFGYTVRVLPRHELLANPVEMGLILWAQ